MMMMANPLTCCECLEQSAVQTARRAIVNILHDCGLAQLSDMEATCKTTIVAVGDFTINKQAEPIGVRKVGSLRLVR